MAGGTVTQGTLRLGEVGPQLEGEPGTVLTFGSDGRTLSGQPGGGGGGTPLSTWFAVDKANAGVQTGAFSGDRAFGTVTGAIGGLPVGGGALAIAAGDYSAEPLIAFAKPVTFQSFGVAVLPVLQPSIDQTFIDWQTQVQVQPTADVFITVQDSTVHAGGASQSTYEVSGNSFITQTGAGGIGNLIIQGGEVSGPITVANAIQATGTRFDTDTITCASCQLVGCSVGAPLVVTGQANITACEMGGENITVGGDLVIDWHSYAEALGRGAVFNVTGQITVVDAPELDFKVGPTNVPSGTANAVIGTVPANLIGRNLKALGGGSMPLFCRLLVATAGYSTGVWLLATMVSDGVTFSITDQNFAFINPANGHNTQITTAGIFLNGANVEVRVTTDPGAGNPLQFTGLLSGQP